MLNRRRPDRKRRNEGHKGEEPLKEEKEKGEVGKEKGEVGRTKTMEESRIEEGEISIPLNSNKITLVNSEVIQNSF